jgi:hypothetical protein
MIRYILFVIVVFPAMIHAQEKTGCTYGNCENGKGTYLYSNGYQYEGSFINGLREGRGLLKGPDGSWYDGMWAKDKFHGQGTHVWPNGAKYTGAWENGVQNGYGIYFYTNGDKYTGYFSDNLFQGQGKYTWADGTSESGLYEKGELAKKVN